MADPDEISDFWVKSLYEQMYAVPTPLRRTSRWRMSYQTFNLLRTLSRRDGLPFWNPSLEPGDPELLLFGLPIDIDESAEGATLRPEEVVRRG